MDGADRMLEGGFLEATSDGSKLKGSTGSLDYRRLRVLASSSEVPKA